MKTCCLTGHRPKGFPWDYADKKCMEHKSYLALLREKVVELISDGYRHFISGGALGADSDFAEIVIDLRKSAYPDITLEIAIPCPNQDLKWCEEDKHRYKKICNAADSVNVISEKYTNFCMQKRNEYMVDQSDFVIVVWNGEKRGGTYRTFQYVKRKKKPFMVIDLQDLPEDIESKIKGAVNKMTVPSFEEVYERLKSRLKW